MSAKERADISRVDERITTTDNKVAQVANAHPAGERDCFSSEPDGARRTKLRTKANTKGIADYGDTSAQKCLELPTDRKRRRDLLDLTRATLDKRCQKLRST